jgi:regulatory protein
MQEDTEPQSESHLPLTERRAYKESIKLLARQDYSRAKMRQKLKQRGVLKDEIEQVLQYLVEKRYLREDLYLEARAKGLITKALSPKSIKQKLSHEGMEASTETIEGFMKDKGVDTDSQLEKLITKKAGRASREDFKGEGGRKLKDKIFRFLMTKGYSFTECKKALELHLKIGLDDADDVHLE